jgi:hypothetical protein
MALSDHPASADLLLWQSGELDPTQAAVVRAHLASCQACQTRLESVESLCEKIAAIDDKASEYRMHAALRNRHPTPYYRLTHAPKWVAVTAAILIVSLVIASISDLTPSARAETLLSEAAKKQAAEGRHPHFLRVQAAGLECNVAMNADSASSRLVFASESDFCGSLSADLISVGWNWNDLLSAGSFLRWRVSLNEKKDTVQKLRDATEVTTATTQGTLRKATLRLRSSDHRPVGGRFVFAGTTGQDRPELEVSESNDLPSTLAHNLPSPEPMIPSAPLRPSAPTVDPLDAKEAEVRLALHEIHADENILLSVSRENDLISVSGVVPNQDSKAGIYGALRSLPQVEASVIAEGEPRQAENASPWQPFRGDTTPLGYKQVNALYPDDPQGRGTFVNGLDTTTRRLVGEAKTRDALLELSSRTRGTDYSTRTGQAAAELQAHEAADAISLAAQLRPLIGAVTSDSSRLTYHRAMDLYTLVHEVVQLNRSDNPLTLEASVARIRALLAGH